MEHPFVTFVIQIDKEHQVGIVKSMLKECGVKYELFVIAPFSFHGNLGFELNPKQVFLNDTCSTGEILSKIILEASTSNIVIIPTPFIAKKEWAREQHRLFDNSTEQCMVVPYIDYMTELEPSHILDGYFDLVNCYTPKKENLLYGVHWFELNVFRNTGSVLGETIDDCLVHYRTKVEGCFFPFINLINVAPVPKKTEINSNYLIHTPLRTLTAVEEIAYHDLPNYFLKANLKAHRFSFDFTATIGFRCESLSMEQLNLLNEFCIFKNVKYEIKSIYLSKEQRLGNNLFVFLSGR
jgi:hypothetical protein